MQKTAFYAASFLTVVLPSAFLTVTADNFLIKFFILSLISVFFIVYGLKSGLKYSWLGYLLSAFIVIRAVSIIWSPNKSVAMDMFWRYFIIIAGGYLLGVNIPENLKKKIMKYIVFGAFIPVIYGLLQLIGGDPVSWSSSFAGRPGSLLGNPNFFSGYLVAVIPIAFYFILAAEKYKKIFPVIVTAAFVFCLIMTETRSSLIALAVQIILLVVLVKDKFVRRSLAVLAVTGIILVFSVPRLRERAIEGINLTSSSVTQRFFKWKTALCMIKDSPIIGQGTGGVKTNYALFQAKARKNFPLKLKGTSESQIHSEYLQVFAETGIIGFFIFIAVMFAGAGRLLRRAEKFYIFLFISVCGILVDSIASFPLYIVPTGFLFYLYLGIGDSLNKEITFPFSFKLITGAVMVLLYLKFSAAAFYADYLRWKADKLRISSFKRADKLYRQAQSISPVDGQAEYRHAKMLFDAGKLDASQKALINSIDIRHYGEVYNDLGIVYYLNKEFDKAVTAWEKAIAIGLPNDEDRERLQQNIMILKGEMRVK